jgi:hypothetical protein
MSCGWRLQLLHAISEGIASHVLRYLCTLWYAIYAQLVPLSLYACCVHRDIVSKRTTLLNRMTIHPRCWDELLDAFKSPYDSYTLRSILQNYSSQMYVMYSRKL